MGLYSIFNITGLLNLHQTLPCQRYFYGHLTQFAYCRISQVFYALFFSICCWPGSGTACLSNFYGLPTSSASCRPWKNTSVSRCRKGTRHQLWFGMWTSFHDKYVKFVFSLLTASDTVVIIRGNQSGFMDIFTAAGKDWCGWWCKYCPRARLLLCEKLPAPVFPRNSCKSTIRHQNPDLGNSFRLSSSSTPRISDVKFRECSQEKRTEPRLMWLKEGRQVLGF